MPEAVLFISLLLGLLVVRLLWTGLRPHPPIYSEKPTLNTRGADPKEPTTGAH